ncbi:glycosyltransferase [Ralstonia pickettii]|uniref:glycosyltransferase n=1 Tax=Ralstonia pickettii TaxID=329 RepID=UPI002714D34C|nr:glycosyltransferase [Ralstonia pickettii]WKZ85925.1 glycosyltransferase [Ralstonia pickettii]
MSATQVSGAVRPITVSVVSHGQIDLLLPLLAQLEQAAALVPLHVVITQNLPERRPSVSESDRFRITWVMNERPLGFGENHNNAFSHCRAECFCVLNPDVRLDASSLTALSDCVRRRPGVAGPRVVSSAGTIEDSARYVPSIRRMLNRWIRRRFVADYSPAVEEQQVDWLAGMCLVFDRATYLRLGGFNPAFKLYCEDVDICLRSHLAGLSVTWNQHAVVQHDAQRASRRKWRYLAWHIGSLVRLMCSKTYWRFRLAQWRIT